MKRLNIVSFYFVHGLFASGARFNNVIVNVNELFNKLFKEEKDGIKNIHSCYSARTNAGRDAIYSLNLMIEKALDEYIYYFEDIFINGLISERKKYKNFKDIECYIYLSFTCHSLGGNVTRGIIHKLYSPYIRDNQEYENYYEYIKSKYTFITDIIPCSYLTINTPHLGSRVAAPKEVGGIGNKLERYFVQRFCNKIDAIGKELTFLEEEITDEENMEDNKDIEIEINSEKDSSIVNEEDEISTSDDKNKNKNNNKNKTNNGSSQENTNTSKEKNKNKKNKEVKIKKLSDSILMKYCEKGPMDNLARFPNRTLTGLLRNDMMVKYCSALGCIETPIVSMLESEKDILIKKKNNDTRIVMYSGYNAGSELEYYKKEIFNDKVSKNFYDNNTKEIISLDIDGQIKNALQSQKKKDKSKKKNKINLNENNEIEENTLELFEKMKDEFLIDNEKQVKVPLGLVKKFNQISFRRVTFDFMVPAGMLKCFLIVYVLMLNILIMINIKSNQL